MTDKHSNPETDEALTSALRQWVVREPLPPRFQEQVWQRIARAETRPALSWASVLQVMMAAFVRPRVAYAYVAVLLLAGFGTGLWTAQVRTTQAETALAERYLQAVNPYQAVAVTQ